MRRTVKCAAAGCPNRTDEKISKEISFHGFPLDTVRKAQWVLALNRTNWKPTTQSILCSEHFRPEDLDRTLTYARVQPNAIPSIFPDQSASNQKKVSEIEQSSQENQNTRLNPSHNRKAVLVYESSSDDELICEAYHEELSDAQVNFRNRHNRELEELDQIIEDNICNQPNVEVISQEVLTVSEFLTKTSTATAARSRKRKRSISNTSHENPAALELNNNSQIVVNPKPCGTLKSVTNLPSNLKPNVLSNPERKRRGRKPRVPENSKPKDISSSKSRAFGGSIMGAANVSLLTSTYKSIASQMVPDRNPRVPKSLQPKDISFSELRAFGGLIVGNDSLAVSTLESNSKLHASQKVVAKPHLAVKEFTENEQVQLDTNVKTILSYTHKEFTEWLIKQGLLKSSQICICHPLAQLKLTLNNDVTSFPYSGGYLWYSDCCPDKIVSVYNGSIFESSPYPPSEILKLIYYWSCQTNYKDMVQLVKVDNSHMRFVNSRLRAICTVAVQSDVSLLGGPGKKVEIGMTTLMGTQLSNRDKRVKVAVLGVLEPETKQIRLCVLETHFNEDSHSGQPLGKILEFLSRWIHPGSVIAIDTIIDKNALFSRGFTNIQQCASTDQNPCNEVIMKYLREILPRMFENTSSLLTINVIQQFLDELVWRERYGTTPLECFSNIVIHISKQSDRFNSIISRLAEVSADPLKNWKPQDL